MKFARALAVAMAVGTLGGSAPGNAADKTGPRELWSVAETDTEGDVRIVVLHRSGAAGVEALRAAPPAHARVRRSFDRVGGRVLKVSPDRLDQTLAALEADPSVVVAAPDRRDQRAVGQVVPWGIGRVNADPASRGSRSGAGVKVAVVDTGIWASPAGAVHPDLAAVYAGGYDFVDDDGQPWDGHGHGTHVAGTVAATNNTFGVVGAAPGVALYALRVLDNAGQGYYSDFIAALDWCIAHGITIANYSAGGTSAWAPLEEACNRARAAGITIVAAAGNYGGGLIYPARYDSVVSVGATDSSNGRPSWSNFGSQLDVAAPGVDILSAYPGGYTRMDGTSMATPHVTGVAALISSRGVGHPDLVQGYLEATATDLGAAGRDPYYGSGLVNAGRALPGTPKILAPVAGETLTSGASYRLDWGTARGAVRYRVFFSRGPGAPWSQIAVTTTGTTKLWRVPAVGSVLTKCRLQVAAYNSSGRLIGIGFLRGFTIQPAGGG